MPVLLLSILLLTFTWLLAGPCPAADAPPPTAAGDKEHSGIDAQTTEATLPAAETGALDTTHGRISRDILERVTLLDKLFEGGTDEGAQRNSYLLRWRNVLRLEEGGRLRYGMTARAHLTLAHISNRLRLVVAGEDASGKSRQHIPQDPGSPGFDRTTTEATTRLVNTEVRYSLVESPAIDSFIGFGVRVRWPPEVFSRWRGQYTHQFGDQTRARFGETVFIKDADGFGETTDITLEQVMGRWLLLRWANSATASQEFDGVELGTELSLIRHFGTSGVITLTGGAYGNSDGPTTFSSYRLLYRHRWRFLRDWLFVELEPEVAWPRNATGSYAPTYAGTLRLEVVFSDASSTRPK